jgi:UDP-N-acetyl-D-mannosaminuronic acid dehydrogenase
VTTERQRSTLPPTFDHDVVIVGGCGHVGLPLGLALADRGKNVVLFDTDTEATGSVNAGEVPFKEPGAPEVLERVLGRRLWASNDPKTVSSAEHVIIVVGTPVDEHLNPDPTMVSNTVSALAPHLRDGQLIVLRSTLYPGTTALVERVIHEADLDVDVTFCPERIAEGKAMTELFELPQIVSARSERAQERATALFQCLTSTIVTLSPEEAELAKLFTNAWRYIKFASANQLFIMANDFGLDYERIRAALAFEYPRASDLPRAGFAAGPCLLKDTMQLAAFNNNNFVLGHAAMTINEGLPLYVVSCLEKRFKLAEMTVGILGMAFKEDSDDIRSSLSYKLKRVLRFKAKSVLCHDPYVSVDEELSSMDDVLDAADLLIIGAPHAIYRSLAPAVPLIDIWGATGRGMIL